MNNISRSDKYMGVILAAGKGTRMHPFSSNYPKPTLPVANKSLLHYQIESMADLGIREIVVVIGHLGFEVVKALGTGEEYGVNIKYVDQGNTLGIAHALGKLESYINRPFLLFLGDIFFVTEDLDTIFPEFEGSNLQSVLLTRLEQDREAIKKNFTVIEDDQGFVKRVIEKPRHIQTKIKDCGLYLFGMQIFDAVRRTPLTALRDEYEITDSIQILIDDGARVKHLPIIKEDINLTTPRDLLNCNLRALEIQKKDYLCGKNTKIPKGSSVTRSVIGKNVQFNGPISLDQCVIFDNTIIDTDQGSEFSNVIFTPFKKIVPMAA